MNERTHPCGRRGTGRRSSGPTGPSGGSTTSSCDASRTGRHCGSPPAGLASTVVGMAWRQATMSECSRSSRYRVRASTRPSTPKTRVRLPRASHSVRRRSAKTEQALDVFHLSQAAVAMGHRSQEDLSDDIVLLEESGRTDLVEAPVIKAVCRLVARVEHRGNVLKELHLTGHPERGCALVAPTCSDTL